MNFFFFHSFNHSISQIYHFIILEFHEFIISLSSTYPNDKLRQIIKEEKCQSKVFLGGMKLTSEDMTIVNYDLLENNTVINSISFLENLSNFNFIFFFFYIVSNQKKKK